MRSELGKRTTTWLLASLVAMACFIAGKEVRERAEPSAVANTTRTSEASPEEAGEAIREARPNFETVSTARGSTVIRLAGQFLPTADLDEVRALAAALENRQDASDVPGLVWHLLAARWVDFEPVEALEFADRHSIPLGLIPRRLRRTQQSTLPIPRSLLRGSSFRG